jgi:hypothetical protein
VFFSEGVSNYFYIKQVYFLSLLYEFSYDFNFVSSVVSSFLTFEFVFLDLVVWKIILFLFLAFIIFHVILLIRKRLNDNFQGIFILSYLFSFIFLIFIFFIFGGNFWWVPLFIIFILKLFFIKGSFFYGDFLIFSVKFLLLYFFVFVMILKVYYWFWVYLVYCLFYYSLKKMYNNLVEGSINRALEVYYAEDKEDFGNYFLFYSKSFSKYHVYADLLNAGFYGEEKASLDEIVLREELDLDVKSIFDELYSNPNVEKLYKHFEYERFRREAEQEKDFFA